MLKGRCGVKRILIYLIAFSSVLCSFPVCVAAEGASIITEAEDFISCCGEYSVGSSGFADFSGDGYLALECASAEYLVEVGTSGYYDISFFTDSTDGESSTAYLYVNGEKYILETAAGECCSWTETSVTGEDGSMLPYGVYLETGVNSVRLVSPEYESRADAEKVNEMISRLPDNPGIENAQNVIDAREAYEKLDDYGKTLVPDYEKLKNALAALEALSLRPSITAESEYYVYEAEYGILGAGSQITQSVPGYGGTGAVKLDGGLTMCVYVPETRFYNIKTTSASGGSSKTDIITVNGESYSAVARAGTAAWQENDIADTAGEELKSGIKLSKGVNIIMIDAKSGGCIYDKISLETVPQLSAVFVVPDLVAPGSPGGNTVWGYEQWYECFLRLKEVGIDTVILQYTAQYWNAQNQFFFYNRPGANNGSQPDYQRRQVLYSLDAAKKHGMKVFLGLQVAEDLWFSDMSSGFSGNFLTESAAFSQMVADELLEQFGEGYYDQIAGWYLPFELNNKQVCGEALERFIDNYLRPVTNYLKQKTPDKQIMMSPLIYHDDLTAPADGTYLEIWKNMCREMWLKTPLDIIAPQDGCGWESTTSYNLAEWYYALYEAANDAAVIEQRRLSGWGEATAWDNAESYNMNGIDQMPVNRLISDMSAAAPYVSGFISFSIHYFVPFEQKNICGVSDGNRFYYDAYKMYYETHKLITDNTRLSAPANVAAVPSGDYGITLSFDRVEGSKQVPVVGYIIKRRLASQDDAEAVKIAELAQLEAGKIIYTDNQLDSGREYTYLVYSFDAFGNRCEIPGRADCALAATGYESGKNYTGVISLGLSASLSETEGISYYDDFESGQFTDGKYGAEIKDWQYDRAQWTGFQRIQGSADYSIELSGFGGKGIGYVYIAMLNQPSAGIALPDRIELFIDEDTQTAAEICPKTVYSDAPTGNIWVGLDLGSVRTAENVTLRITQSAEWTMLSEITVWEAEDNGFGHRKLNNIAQGRPLIFDGDCSGTFGFNSVSGSFFTYSATRDGAAPGIAYRDDETQTQLAGLNNAGNPYTLRIEFSGNEPVNMIGSRWIQDENLGIYIPDSIWYYGVDASGNKELIARTYSKSRPQLDWTAPPSENNTRAEKEADFRAVTAGKNYTAIEIEVYPRYANAWTFINNFYIY